MAILLLAVVLSCLGVVMVYSASAVMAMERHNDSFFFLKRQGIYVATGFVAMVCAMYFDYRHLRRLAVPLLLLCLGMLSLLLIPGVGHSANGAVRWFRFAGISIQPSELAKIALVIYLAHSLAKKQDRVRSFTKGFLPYVLVLGALLILILREPDLGSAVVIGAVGVTMMFAAGVKLRYLFAMAALVAPVLYLAIVKVPYRRERLMAFLNPWESPDKSGYQIIQSQIAFDGGGLWGQGLGQGLQKLFYLPEAHTDFIFSVLGEELGFIGVLVVAGMFLLLVVLGMRVALGAADEFGCNLAFGLTVLLGMEAFLNIAVVLGMLPPKGMALPFISYGGSSLVCCLLAVGILLSVSRHPGEAKT
ncbi:MAG: putative lipid II flippase FtsW [Desulfuromonadaceae bacterium]|nr:putative lipid II flippase FtsW [Desulfuromonadaceae bacterium]